MATPEQLGQQIKRKREERGQTQVRFAKELGITQPQLSQIERGNFENVALEKLQAVAGHLGLNPDSFVTVKVQPSVDAVICEHWYCPTHMLALMGGDLLVYVRPRRAAADEHCCGLCQGDLISACPHCKRPLSGGAYCTGCRQTILPSPTESEVVKARGPNCLMRAKGGPDVIAWLNQQS